jgi:hypothetical protein
MIQEKAAFMIRLLAFALLISAINLSAQTVAANSCSYTDVQSAVNAAARGATVTVPAGNCSWSSPLTLTKGIKLQGSGAGKTVITWGNMSPNANPIIYISPDSTVLTNEEVIQVSGFTLDGNDSAWHLISIDGPGAASSKPFKKLVIGNNRLQSTGTSTCCASDYSSSGAVFGHGQIRGVIYGNIFDRCNMTFRFNGDDTASYSGSEFEWWNPAYYPFAYGMGATNSYPGGGDNLYFEDNTIQFSSSFNGQDPGWDYTDQGPRIVERYNTWNFANVSTPTEIHDRHGFQNWPSNGTTGTMPVEQYGNTYTNAGQYRWINHRATWGLFFDNILSGSGGNSIDLYGMSTPGACPSQISPTPNFDPTVNNTYFFNNTVNGTIKNASMVSTGDPTSTGQCSVTENHNWWNYSAACTASSCTAGVGRGTTAPTGSCNGGTAYWVASTVTPTTSSSVIQTGALYQCQGVALGASGGHWVAYYQPYTYPHPLRSSSSTTLAPPTNLSAIVQ